MTEEEEENPREILLIELTELEEHLGQALHDDPIHLTDQWTAGVRNLFSGLGVDVNDARDAKAAHAGAYLMLSTIFTGGGAVPWGTAVSASYLWRYLSDCADDDE